MSTSLKNKCILPLLAILFLTIFVSCHKNITEQLAATENTGLLAKTISSVSGFVTDENNVPVQSASVKVGTASTSVLTDQFGYFAVKDVEVNKIAATVTVSKPGYFKGFKTWEATSGNAAFFRIKLIPKTIAGIISASSGGNVSLSNGLIIALPSNGVVNASNNIVYTGNIHVAVSWLNPEANDLDEIMPGDMRGIEESGAIKGLTTFGMAAVELFDDAGELLQIATGKKATITMPLSSLLSATAPPTIPLWYFNENNGLWKEEGSAVKTGNAYVGDVSHFTYWNCDIPNATVAVRFTVIDHEGNPVANTHVNIAPPNSNGIWPASYGYTNDDGTVSAFVEANTAYDLKIASNCNAPVYLQSFSTTTTPIDLGSIIIPATVSASVTGTVSNCSGAPVANGHMMVINNNQYYNYPLGDNGAFSFTTLVCYGNSLPATFIAIDNSGLQQSAAIVHALNPGQNSVGNILACNGSEIQYITYSFDGGVTNFTLTAPADSIIDNGDFSQGYSHFEAVTPGQNNIIAFGITNTGIHVGSTNQTLTNFYSSKLSQSVTVANAPVWINITEVGPTGGYIAGNYTATLTGNTTADTYSVTCSFRIRRYF